MPLPTYKQTLRADGASLVATLVGCSGEGSGSSSDVPSGPPPDTLVVDHDHLQLRNDVEAAIFRDTARDDKGMRSLYLNDLLATTDEGRENAASTTETDGIDEVRVFIDEMGFGGQTLVTTQYRTGACHCVKLLYVAYPPNSVVDLDFCRPLRPASVEYSVDGHHAVTSLVRLPYSS